MWDDQLIAWRDLEVVVVVAAAHAALPPPPGGPPPAPADFFLGFSATSASVVSIRLATEAAFCSAVRTTLVGSMTPALTRSS